MRINWAEWRGPIYGRTASGFQHPALGCVLHIMGSSTQSADNWFHSPKSGDPAAGAGATFGVCNGGSTRVNPAWVDGHLIQWADIDDRTWAQGSGNLKYYSIETEGSGGPLTQAQVQTVAKLYKELASRDGFPYTLAEKPGDLGFGWHGMGGSAWGGHNYCPGPERKAQRAEILRIAQGGQASTPPQGDNDMTDDQAKQLAKLYEIFTAKPGGNDVLEWAIRNGLSDNHLTAVVEAAVVKVLRPGKDGGNDELRGQISGLIAAELAKHPGGGGPSAAEIADKLAERLKD